MRAGILGAVLAVLAGTAGAEEVTAADWAAAARPGITAGNYGVPFVVVGRTGGCFDEEGFQVCAVNGEGIEWTSAYGSASHEAVLDLIGKLPVGTEVELSGDMVTDMGDRVEAVFSHILPPM